MSYLQRWFHQASRLYLRRDYNIGLATVLAKQASREGYFRIVAEQRMTMSAEQKFHAS